MSTDYKIKLILVKLTVQILHMSYKRISPPFPFPKSWDLVRGFQMNTNTVNWTVPSYSLNEIQLLCDANRNDNQSLNVSNCSDYVSTGDISSEPAEIPDSEFNLNEEGEEEEVLVMSQEWVDRLSKTMKRKQKKAYKVNKNNKNKL